MRMTVRITAGVHRRLRRLAAERGDGGDRGVAHVVADAIEAYVRSRTPTPGKADALRRGLDVLGRWDDEQAEAIRRRVHRAREQWR
jgi:hypothetical protein